MGMKIEQVRAEVARRGHISRGQHPELATGIDHLVRRGELVRVLPGVYAAAALTGADLAQAIATWNPNAVIVGAAAAAAHLGDQWPEVIEVLIEAHPVANPAVRIRRGLRLDPDLVMSESDDGPRVLTPAAAAVWQAATDDGATIDDALRRKLVTLEQLHRAVDALGRRPGSGTWRRVVDDSRDQPWSPAERKAHRQLRAAGLTGWTANRWFHLADMNFPADIVLERAMVVVEVDGFAFHSDRETFERDRAKTNALVRAGWLVLRVTWEQLDDPAYLPALLRDVLALRGALSRC